ncbi:MAG: hypothetical protein ACJ77M_10015 [Thermoleophilaceae bacterium]
MKIRLTILAICALGLAVPGTALAAGPTATTGGAKSITATTATLTGSVDPNHNATSFHFEYGRTTSYGSRTPDGPTDATKGSQPVSQNVTGLAPTTTYHYRVVATSPGFTVLGKDRTFKTPAPPPNSVTVAPNPATTVFGASTVLSGQLTGPQNAGVTITLQQRPFPFAGGFQNVTTAPTDNNGFFSFTVTPIVDTQYQVQARTSPRVTSPVTQASVAYATSMRTKGKRVHHGKRVKFSGVVTPAHDGAVVMIEKRGKGGVFRTIAKTVLKHSTTLPQSTYSRNVRIRRGGVFRVHVIGDASRADGFSPLKRIRA